MLYATILRSFKGEAILLKTPSIIMFLWNGKKTVFVALFIACLISWVELCSSSP